MPLHCPLKLDHHPHLLDGTDDRKTLNHNHPIPVVSLPSPYEEYPEPMPNQSILTTTKKSRLTTSKWTWTQLVKRRLDQLGHYDPIMNESEQAGPSDFAFQSRSYDDEDEALQAALKASMDDLPADWKAPEVKPVRKSITSAADRMKAAQDKAQAALKKESDLRAEVEAEEAKRQREAAEEEQEEKLEDLSPGESLDIAAIT
jgi:hypothetical protein